MSFYEPSDDDEVTIYMPVSVPRSLAKSLCQHRNLRIDQGGMVCSNCGVRKEMGETW